MKAVAFAFAIALLGVASPHPTASSLAMARGFLLPVLQHDRDDAGTCSPAELRAAADTAEVQVLDMIPRGDIVLYGVHHSCLCGAQNCPYFVVRVIPGETPRLLFTTFGIRARGAARTGVLNDLIVAAHDSALVTVETRYMFAYGKYQPLRSERVRNTDGARKPDGMPVHFPLGASSAQLHGSVSLGWYDAYAFDASKGQRLTVDGVRSRAALRLSVFGPAGSYAALRAGVPYVLPTAGRYQLHVDNDAEQDVPYALTLAIR